jgi:hypothetical protein
MKKLLLIVCCFVFLSNYSKAQLDTIPNSGFESWYYFPNNTIQATGWHNNNSSIAAWNVTPDSISNTGILSLKIEKVSYRGITWSGFPVSQHPLSLDGTMKNGLNIGDTALIQVYVYAANTIVDSGHAEIYGGIGSVFLPFTTNITQNFSTADSCVIILTGGNIYNSVIWFDDLSFSFATSVNENFSDDGWMVFPNPVENEFTIYGLRSTISKIEIRNALGQQVFSEPRITNLGQQTVDVSKLSQGAYVLSVISGKKVSNHIIIKN